ncbi:MAG: hypothetical protein L3J98_15515 [Gammaproteobacteria bacterium]|nr:hypothetical protein [Gammaproteobacteria bacterium]MCF6261545.1 hypothetical protein [Gammaproteobacteria bacterium]
MSWSLSRLVEPLRLFHPTRFSLMVYAAGGHVFLPTLWLRVRNISKVKVLTE